jgi:poly [ADP-ribose] polymerase
MANVIEEAKSGRASCRTCKKPIAKGELRFGHEVMTQFSSDPTLQWHHLLCAAAKLPAELKTALDEFSGTVGNRDEIDKAMGAAIEKGNATPGGYPHADRAPTGRAKCMQCEQPIEKGSIRMVVEREIDTGAMVTRGSGYMHPKCVVENLENVGGSVDDFVDSVRKNSRIPKNELDAAIAQIETA